MLVKLFYTFVYPAKTPEVHLVRAVKHHNILAQTATHVFCGLSLASTGWPCRSSSHAHIQSLGQRDVTPADKGVVLEFTFISKSCIQS